MTGQAGRNRHPEGIAAVRAAFNEAATTPADPTRREDTEETPDARA